uniref:non-specific serine/threonine protein kinase n=1 Tax=Anopheles atroparvus TaxID=41427 RepID=A0A182JAD4_ANOAO
MYVVKIEPHSNGPLFVEIHCLLNTAKRSDTCHIPPGMPEYIASGSHIFKDERYRFLILKRYERDLHSLIKNKRVNPKSIPVVACQILDVLEHLHDQGYVHSDIKAENLMIGKVPQEAGGASANGRNGVAVCPQRPSNGTASTETGKGGRRGGRKGGAPVLQAADIVGHLLENGLYQHQEQEMGGRVRNLRPLKTVTYRDLSDEDDRSRGASSAGGGVGGGGVAGSKTDRSAYRRRGRKKTDDASFSCSISPRRSGYEELRAATEEAHWNELRQHKHHLRAAADGGAAERKPTVPLEDRIHLIDFGLASKFMDSSGQHRPFCMDQRRAHDGTLEFTSRDAHMGAHARRSDLECLGYNLVYWSRGFLPWKDEKLLNQPEQVHRMKEYFMTDVREMQRLVYGDDCPAYLGDFLAYVSQLTYDERPDYQHCRSLFLKELKRLGCPVGRNQALRLDVDAIERLSEPLTAQDEAEITNKINHVKSLMKLGGALFPYRESTLHSKASSPKNLRSKRRDAANGGRNSLAAADGVQAAAGGVSAPGGGPLVASNVVSTRKREKKISCEEIFATDADQIARERVEKEYERAEQMEETVIRYTGRPTYAIQELERKIRNGGGGHNGWCGGGGGGASGGLEYTESEDYIKGYTKPMMDILRKRQSQLFREIAAANSTANRNKEEPAVKDDHQQHEVKQTKAIQAANRQLETKSDNDAVEGVEQDEAENNEGKEPCCSEDEEDDEEMEKRLSREKYYHDTDYEVQADEEEEDDELSTVEEEEEEEEEEEDDDEEEEEEQEEDDQYEEEEDTASAALALHNGHATRKRPTSSVKSRQKKAPASKTAHHHHHKQQEEDTDSDFFNDGGCDGEEAEEEEEEEELEEENEMEESDGGSAKDEDAIVADDGVGEQEDGQEDEEEEDQQDSDFNDQESTTSGSDVVIPGKRRRIVSSTIGGGHRRGSGKKSSPNGRTLKAKVKGRGRKRSNTSSKTREMEIHGSNGDDETLVNGYGSVDGCSIEKVTNKAGGRRHSKKKKHHQKQVVAHDCDDEEDGDNARHNGNAPVPVTVVRQSHHHNNNNHCNSKAYYGDVDDSSHDMAPPANGNGDGLMMSSGGGGGGGGGGGESKYRLVKRRKSCLRERIRPTDRGNDYDQQRKQKAAQRNKRRSETAVLRLSAGLQDSRGVHELESTLNDDDEEVSCSSSTNISSASTGSSSSSSSSSSTGSGSASSSGSSTSRHSIGMSSRGRTGSVPSSVVSEEAAFAIASFRAEDQPAQAAGAQKRKRGRPRKVPAQPAAEAAAAPVAHAFDTQDSSNSSSTTRRRQHEEPIVAEQPAAAVGGCISDASQTRWSRANSSHSNRSAGNSRASSVSTSTTGSGAAEGASTHHDYGCSRGRLPTLPEDDDFLDEDDDDTRDVDYSPVCTRRKRKALTTAMTSTSSSTGNGNGISRKTTATNAPVRRRNDSSKVSHVADSGFGASGGPPVAVAIAHRPEPEPPQPPVVVAIQPNRGRRFPQHQDFYHPIEEPMAPLHPHHHHHHQHLQHHHPPTMLVRTYSRG